MSETTPPPGSMPAYSPPVQPYYPHPAAPMQVGTNGLAIASLVLGILWLGGLGSVLAIIFGFIALSQMKRSYEGGRGLAIAGTVLGFVGSVGMVLVLLVTFALGSAVKSNFQETCNAISTDGSVSATCAP